MDTILRLCDMFSVSLDTLLRGDAQAEALSDTAGYDRFMDRFAWKISLSIGAILLGAAVMSLLEGLGVPWMLYGGLFFTIVAAAVTVMVASGIQYDNFRKRHPVIPRLISPFSCKKLYRKYPVANKKIHGSNGK